MVTSVDISRRRLLAGLVLVLVLAACAPSATTPDERPGGTGNESEQMNEDVENLRDAVTAVEARVDAAHSGTHRVAPLDLAPLDAATSFLRTKGELVVSGSDFGCFGTRLRLPDGATITEFAATSYAADTDASAETYLEQRAWDVQPADGLAQVAAASNDYQETVAAGGSLPVTVDAGNYAYRVLVCLEGNSGFLGARVAYELP